MKDPNGYNVRAVERALQILNCFNDEHPEKGVSEIAHLAGLHKATTHRIITTLANYGYLERASDGKNYRLGLELTELGYKAVRWMDFRREAYPYMTRLAQQWEEACDLSVFNRGEVLYVEVIKSNHTLTIAAAIGQRLPAHSTASGKLFLANLPSHELNAVLNHPLASFTKKTITSTDVLNKQLAEIRQNGYGYDDEEYEVGIRAVSAPIRNREGSVIAAMSIPSPTSRMTMDRIPEIAEALIGATQAISRRIGWNI